jgi:hypothetical protein
VSHPLLRYLSEGLLSCLEIEANGSCHISTARLLGAHLATPLQDQVEWHTVIQIVNQHMANG